MGFFKRLLSVGSKKDKSKSAKSGKGQRAPAPPQTPSRMLLEEAEAESTITRMLRSSSVKVLTERDFLAPPSPMREYLSCPLLVAQLSCV